MSSQEQPQLDWKVVLNRAAPKGQRGWGRVRAAQIDETCRAFNIAMSGQVVNAILLAVILGDHVAQRTLALWLSVLLGLILVGLREQHSWRKLRAPAVSAKATERIAWYSVAFGLVWAVPAIFFFPSADDAQRLAIGIVTASMMAGATFVFTTVPQASGGYVCIMGAAATSMLSSTGSLIIAAIAPIYTAGLVVMALSNGRAFMQRRLIEYALEERTDTVNLLLRDYENSNADWLWETDYSGSLRKVSNRFARALGSSVEEVEGSFLLDALGQRSASAADGLAAIAAAVKERGSFTEVIVTLQVDSETRCIELSARPRFNDQNRFLGYRGVGSDVTVAKLAASRIEHMARYDALTNLPNRVQVLDAMQAALENARATGGQCAMLLLDLDRFKAVNDTLGHVAGDHLLQQVPDRLAPLLVRGMMAGRLGGDEFAIVVPDVSSMESLERLSLAIIDAVKAPFIYDDQHLFVGVSIGVAVGPQDSDNVPDLIRNADLALYRAKSEGGNDLYFYEPELHARAEERRKIEVAMRDALEAGEFRLVYQPVVEASTGKVASCEALLRWSSRTLGEVSPASFIPLAEETGLVRRIGEWVLREAVAEAVRWPEDVGIAVNISPLQLAEPNFMLTLVSALAQSGLEPHRLELEITETVFLHLTGETQKVLTQIQSLGVRLAIDDFGTGYSSLGYLQNSRFDTIKIDRSFIQRLARTDRESGAIVKAVVAIADSLGMTTVAEGVETEEQMDIIREYGCNKIQGFLLSRPQPRAEIRALLAQGALRIAA
jgi:diguanylate cyclase (GGDEF)-like protein